MKPDVDFRREMLRPVEERDSRGERVWQLVSILRGGDGSSPRSQAFGWIYAALEVLTPA